MPARKAWRLGIFFTEIYLSNTTNRDLRRARSRNGLMDSRAEPDRAPCSAGKETNGAAVIATATAEPSKRNQILRSRNPRFF
jgi:hypothetical protein